MSNLCIIPARGGSKRIPRKNIKDFLGKPIIAYSIETALASGLFDEVMVSTDDEEIAVIGEKFGAKVPFIRSTQNANDHATTADVLEEVLNNYKTVLNKSFDYACCLYPTSPLTQIVHLEQGLKKIIRYQLDSVLPVTPFSFPIQRALQIIDYKISFVNPEFAITRSQDLELRYHDAGQWYWFDCNAILNNHSLLTNNTSCIMMDETMVQDIDNESDWKIAELKYKLINSL